VAFSQMAVEMGDVVVAIEANPVIAWPHGVIAVDALVQVQNR
jgi:acetate---CoA ligase (ADP-forming)